MRKAFISATAVLIIGALLVWSSVPQRANAAVVRVHAMSTTLAASATNLVTLGFTTTVGNTVVVFYTPRSGTTACSAAISGGSTVQPIKIGSGGSSELCVNYFLNAPATTSVSITYGGAVVSAVTVLEYSGVNAVQDDGHNTSANGTATWISGQITTTDSTDVILAGDGGSANVASASFTNSGPSDDTGTTGAWAQVSNIDNNGGSTSVGEAVAEVIPGSTLTAGAKWTAATNGVNAGGILALKGASGGGGGTTAQPAQAVLFGDW